MLNILHSEVQYSTKQLEYVSLYTVYSKTKSSPCLPLEENFDVIISNTRSLNSDLLPHRIDCLVSLNYHEEAAELKLRFTALQN